MLGLDPDVSFARASFVFWVYLILVLGLIALALIDLDHMILPDELTLGGAALGLADGAVPPRRHFD